jgi:hypothetical protein
MPRARLGRSRNLAAASLGVGRARLVRDG